MDVREDNGWNHPNVPGWRTLASSSRVYAVDGSAYLNRSGPRLVDSLEILAHLIQPRLFPDLPGHLAGSQVFARVN